jgi:hypothetical protein
MQAHGKRPSIGEMLLQHTIVFLICVVFPGIVTLFAPATWLTFERNREAVRCTARTCMFFVVPFKTQQVEQVIAIEQRERNGGIRKETKLGRTTGKNIHVDGEGFLQIRGVGDRLAKVSVSPASLENVVNRSTEFLNSNKEGSTTIFAIANWKFGGLMGGILTSLTLLYVVGYSISFVMLILAGMRRTLTRFKNGGSRS